MLDEEGLAAYGWDEDWSRAARQAAGAAGPVRAGRLVRVERGECDVVGPRGVERVASDALRAQDAVAPATGDWVLVRDDPDIGPVIDAVLERRRALVRRDPSEEVVEQVLVANIDAVGIVHGLDRPLRPGRIERFLVLAGDSGATPLVVLTKGDLVDRGAVTEVRATVGALAPGVEVLVTGRDPAGALAAAAERLRPFVPVGHTLVLIGESGTGKSTLVNALLGESRQATGAVRDTDAAGRHTTVTRDLVPVPDGGLIIDTPGVRAVGVWDAEDALGRVFSDIVDLAAGCRFGDCAHGPEPGCAVTAAVAAGTLDGRRLERYRLMVDELTEQARRQEERARRTDRGRRR